MVKKDIIREDFDRIASLEGTKWDHNVHYHRYLKKFIPLKVENALDIGCGTGDFTRELARNAKSVAGIDLSPEMIKKARILSRDYKNIDFLVSDVMEYPFNEEVHDCIVSIAAMHHLPMEIVLGKAKMALKPGGVLLILDLYKRKSVVDFLLALTAIPINIFLFTIKTGRVKRSREEAEEWDKHVKHDTYLTIKELKKICRELLPGAILKRHLFWRYSIIWKKS